jgi:predicted nucleotidyltransferase component of viral defense system
VVASRARPRRAHRLPSYRFSEDLDFTVPKGLIYDADAYRQQELHIRAATVLYNLTMQRKAGGSEKRAGMDVRE